MRALIVEDGESRGALAAARALHSAGWEVGVAAPVRSPAGVSRSVLRRHVVPDATATPDSFLEAVERAVQDNRYDVVFGAGDAEVFRLSADRARVSAVVPYPSHDVVVATLDKALMEPAARAAGLRVPVTLDPATLNGTGPYLVKPLAHAEPGQSGPSRMEARRLPDADAARRRVREIEDVGRRAVVQEVVDGELSALVLLVDAAGAVVAAVQQRAERLQPPTAGVSARAVTTPVDEELAARAASFLRSTGWWGLAELQFLGRPGEPPTLIDVNGRFYGSLALAVASGPNLPDLWGRLALGEDLPTGARGRPGVHYQWLEGDLRAAVALRQPSLVRDLLGTVAIAPMRTHSTLSAADPAPGLHAAARLVGRGVRKLRRPGSDQER